jgi:hypothetical protein
MDYTRGRKYIRKTRSKTMKSGKAVLLALGVVLCGVSAFGQTNPIGRSEAVIDYSYIRGHANNYLAQPFNLNGGGASYVFFLNNVIGIKADLDGYGSTTQHYNNVTCAGKPCNISVSGNLFTYTGGVEIKNRGKFQPFGDLLLGGAHTNAIGNAYTAEGGKGASPSNNGFALIVGGGIDLAVKERISLRLGEFDYELIHFGSAALGGGNTSNFRYQAGVVFNF